MASVNQDFVTYAGDTVTPIFTVVDVNGQPVNISTVTQITWTCFRSLQLSTPLITKTLTGGEITFTGIGTNGQFQVTILPADTQSLSGWYIHQASIADASGNQTTVTVGRMNVGLAPNWTYDDGSSATQDIYYVRGLIGDTIESDQLLSDQIIFASLDNYSTTELAAAECCRMIAARFARQVDVVQGELKTNYSNRRKAYMAQAVDLETRGMARGGAQAYAGGISAEDKIANVCDPDRVSPQFNIGMFDNLLPESPVGHETNEQTSSDEGQTY
jgi:hypothetical protein